jgi:hypothetical protein
VSNRGSLAIPVAYSLFDDASQIPARLRARLSRKKVAESDRAEAAA